MVMKDEWSFVGFTEDNSQNSEFCFGICVIDNDMRNGAFDWGFV